MCYVHAKSAKSRPNPPLPAPIIIKRHLITCSDNAAILGGALLQLHFLFRVPMLLMRTAAFSPPAVSPTRKMLHLRSRCRLLVAFSWIIVEAQRRCRRNIKWQVDPYSVFFLFFQNELCRIPTCQENGFVADVTGEVCWCHLDVFWMLNDGKCVQRQITTNKSLKRNN